MTDSPKITFWAYDINSSYPKIEPASVRREWMDKTYNKLAYLCTPLMDAMSDGWEIRLPQDVVVIWDGISEGLDGENQDHVSIISGQFYKDIKIASTDTGIGAITFVFSVVAETDDDHYLTISGPPNYMFKDAQALTGLLRSNRFMEHPMQITWKINTSNKEILFPKGMPICFIKINKKNTASLTNVEIKQLSNEMKNKFIKYNKMKAEHFNKNGQYDYPQLYKNGINENGEKILPTIKINKLKTIKYIKEE